MPRSPLCAGFTECLIVIIRSGIIAEAIDADAIGIERNTFADQIDHLLCAFIDFDL